MDFKCTKIDQINIDDYRKWVDIVIRSDLPDPNNEPALFELIKYIVIQKLVVNIATKSAGSVLVNISQPKS